MTVNGQMPDAVKRPRVLLVDFHPNQVRHHVAQAAIVVPFQPDNFNFALGVGELADVSEKLPMLFLQTTEVEIAKDVAEQNEPTKRDRAQGV